MPERIYVDSCVLVFHFITRFEPRYSAKCKELLEKVESGKYEAMISLFALMELVKQIRELLVKQNVFDHGEWQESVKEAVEAIFRMKNVKIVEGNPDERKAIATDSGLSHSAIAWDSFDIINKYQGSVKRRKNEFEHDGIHPVDAVHISLARKMGCSMIATLDRDFREADSEVKSLLLQEDIY
jgi:predicted nucleic acid-binding protein